MTSPTGAGRIAISGASGFLGRALIPPLEAAGWEVHRLVRRTPGPREIGWDPAAGRIDAAALEGMSAVVHLAGESIAGIWTPAKKRRIMESRARGTRLLATAVAALANKPRIFVSASGVGYYGDAGEEPLTEDHPPGEDFIARVCVAWEEGTRAAAEAGVRVVRCRWGLVFHPSGGALRLMLPFFRLGLGARLGSGRQWLSWIALADAVRVVRFALEDDRVEGPINGVSPEPVRNREFTKVLARTVSRPAFLVAPGFALDLVTGGMAESLLLASQRAVPSKLQGLGFRFERPHLEAALRIGDT